MTKKSYLYDRFFVSNRNFTTDYVKNIKNSRFYDQISRFFHVFFKVFQIPGYFCLNCRSPGFSRFPGKVATLERWVLQIFKEGKDLETGQICTRVKCMHQDTFQRIINFGRELKNNLKQNQLKKLPTKVKG